MARFSDYVLTPRDLWGFARGLSPRDVRGLALAAVIGVVVALWLTEIGAGLFAAGLVAALYWRIDSRWPLAIALGLLVLIPLMQFAYDRNWLFWGQDIAGGLAVAVWYLLAIGVVRQVVALRSEARAPGSAAPAHRRPIGPQYAPDGRLVPHDPIPFHASLRRQRMVARRVLGKIEQLRVDGIRAQPRKPTDSRKPADRRWHR